MQLRTKNKEEAFWSWFVINKSRFEKGLEDQNYEFVNDIGKRIKEYHPDLAFELGQNEKKEYDFVISCEGLFEYIPVVEKLAHAAPYIEGWVITKFRQPKQSHQDLQINGKTFRQEDFRFKAKPGKEKTDLSVFIPGYNENDSIYLNVAFLTLDNLLGEFNVMTKIGRLDFYDLNRTKETGLITASDLKTLVDSMGKG